MNCKHDSNVMISRSIWIFSLFWTTSVLADLPPSPFLVSDDFGIQFINRHQTGKVGGWKAARNFFSGTSRVQKGLRAGTIIRPKAEALALNITFLRPQKNRAAVVLPVTFDARTAWPGCASLTEIRDQMDCGSCWAHSGAEVISDRICIVSGSAATYFQASVEDINSCSGDKLSTCAGGYTEQPYVMLEAKGVVTGGGFQSRSGCKPYTQTDVNCTLQCTNKAYTVTYPKDKSFGNKAYVLGNLFATQKEVAPAQSVIDAIRTDLMTNGPMTVQFLVYEDFYSYSSGIYQHVAGEEIGGHAVKLIGWGTDGGVDYWLLANSWGSDWGMKGFLKFRRGINHLGIEDYVVASIPRLHTATASTTTTKVTTTTQTTTTVGPPSSTPPIAGRPQGYDTCDFLFCSVLVRRDGYYQVSACSRNYCWCSGGVATWYGCPAGQFYDGGSGACEAVSATACATKLVAPTASLTAWPAPPSSISALCNFANCDGRSIVPAWYPLGLCSPYWCYCFSTATAPKLSSVQTCSAGQYFDFRSDVAACADKRTLPWC